MSKSKHTPGPWLREGTLVYSLEHHSWHKGEELKRNRFHAAIQGYSQTPTEELDANARLISAAPDLLLVAQLEEALEMPYAEGQQILAAHGYVHADRFELSATEFVKRMRRAATAKATGAAVNTTKTAA